MPQTRPNKMTAPVNADAYNLTADLATMADSSNVVIPVASQAERDALTKKAGMVVIRTDLPGAPLERCDGTTWWNTQHSEWTFSATGIPTGSVWGTNTLTLDTANSTDTGFISCPGADQLTIRDAGIYAIHLVGQWGTGTTGRGFSQITNSGATTVFTRSSAAVGEDQLSVNVPDLRVAANTTIKLTTYLTFAGGGTTTWAGRVRVTRIGY